MRMGRTQRDTPLGTSTSSADMLCHEAKRMQNLGYGHFASHEATSAPSMAMSMWLTSRERPLVLTKEFCLKWVPGRSAFSVGCSMGLRLWMMALDLVISDGCTFGETSCPYRLNVSWVESELPRPIRAIVKTKTKLLWTEQTPKLLQGQRRT